MKDEYDYKVTIKNWCPICQRRVGYLWDESAKLWQHMVAEHGWKQPGTVFQVQPTKRVGSYDAPKVTREVTFTLDGTKIVDIKSHKVPEESK